MELDEQYTADMVKLENSLIEALKSEIKDVLYPEHLDSAFNFIRDFKQELEMLEDYTAEIDSLCTNYSSTIFDCINDSVRCKNKS